VVGLELQRAVLRESPPGRARCDRSAAQDRTAARRRCAALAEAAGICNDPIEPAVAALAEAVGCTVHLSRVNPHELRLRPVWGLERKGRRRGAGVEEGDEAYIVNVAQHPETLIGHAFRSTAERRQG
jgi:hypothetical protein